ncbi:hypothetical protein C8J56DRAFT_485762 [Mycena floridula]|nr:hypothetical protein C8J56DRAFT_485762 [Mycena floridula]
MHDHSEEWDDDDEDEDFYMEPEDQLMRLLSSRSLFQAGIPSVLWGDDALSFVFRAGFDGLGTQQVLVPDNAVTEAVSVICANHPYTIGDGSQDEQWADHSMFNKDRPYAFQNTPTTLLVHKDPELRFSAFGSILIHAASTWHFDIHDKSRTCTNPNPPGLDEATQSVRFPTLGPRCMILHSSSLCMSPIMDLAPLKPASSFLLANVSCRKSKKRIGLT